MVYYLQGLGERNDAHFVFNQDNKDTVLVVAEVGMGGCYDDVMRIEEARKVYNTLRKLGWRKVDRSRRDLAKLQSDIRD